MQASQLAMGFGPLFLKIVAYHLQCIFETKHESLSTSKAVKPGCDRHTLSEPGSRLLLLLSTLLFAPPCSNNEVFSLKTRE